jgi:chromosomal replication initiation ATPase DnaA
MKKYFQILNEVALEFDLPTATILFGNRKPKIVVARQILMWSMLCHGYSVMNIAVTLDKNHATVNYGITRINELFSVKDEETVTAVRNIEFRLINKRTNQNILAA